MERSIFRWSAFPRPRVIARRHSVHMNWRIRARTRATENDQPLGERSAGVHLGTTVFPAVPGAVGAARRWLTCRLGAAHPAGDDAVLLLSEAFTNGVRYGGGEEIAVTVRARDHGIRVEVVDAGGGAGAGGAVPHYVDDPSGERGRGLPIMQALARDWGFDRLPDGRLLVWFEMDGGYEPAR